MSLNKVVAALLAVILVGFALFVILAWSVERGVLEADVYVTSLEEADFFEVPYELIRVGEIPTPGGLLLLEGPLSVVSGPDLEAIARELAPPTWLRDQIERAIRDLVVVAQRQDLERLPGFVISLREVKARTLGEPGDRALAIVLNALPVCGADRQPLELNSDIPVCKPAGVDLGSFASQLKLLLVPLVQRVPDTYRVSWQPEQRQVLDDLQRAGQTLDQLRIGLLLLTALSLALLGLIWVLAVRSAAEWLRWTGLPILMVGVMVLLAAFLIPRLVAWGIDSQALALEENLPIPLAHAMEGAIQEFSLALFRPAWVVGGVLAALGFVMMLISPLFPGRRGRAVVRAPAAGGRLRY
jgi:hypothetical protein